MKYFSTGQFGGRQTAVVPGKRRYKSRAASLCRGASGLLFNCGSVSVASATDLRTLRKAGVLCFGVGLPLLLFSPALALVLSLFQCKVTLYYLTLTYQVRSLEELLVFHSVQEMLPLILIYSFFFPLSPKSQRKKNLMHKNQIL